MTDEVGPLTLPERLASERVRLILVTLDDAADMRDGRHQERWHPDYPRQDDRDAATMIHEPSTWGPRHLVHEGLAVGSIGFFGPPESPGSASGSAPGSASGSASSDDTPEVEVGYGLVEDARGRGLATEALRCVLVETDRLGVRVRARTEPTNRASVRVLAKAGFTELRGSDEEGLLVMARPVAR